MDLAFGEQKKKKGPSKAWTEKEVEAELKKFDDKIEDAKQN